MSAFSAPYFHDEAAAYQMLESYLWPHGPVCPKCGGTDRITLSKGGRIGLYRCGPCKRKFTIKVGTVLESSHVPLTEWLQVAYLMVSSKKGVSSHQVMRTLGCQYKTAWFMTHRLREAMKVTPWPHGGKMGGAGQTVEADETYIGRKSTSRAFEPPAPKQSVFALVERNGAVRSFHVPNVTANNLAPVIARYVHADSRFMTDEAPMYARPGTWFVAGHQTVNHAAKEYVRDDAYTNTIEGYFSILKRGIYGIYQHVSEAHLHHYLCEYDFRYTHRAARGVDDMERMRLALAGIVGKRLTYRGTDRNRSAQAQA
jgi:transposase-like protein